MTYYWKCQYNDGIEIRSKDGYKYRDIDRTRLKKFVLLQVDNDKPVLVLNLSGNKRLICRTRTAINVQSKARETVWIVGYQETVLYRLTTLQVICFVFPDGTIEVTDGFKEGHEWFYPVKFLPEEL